MADFVAQPLGGPVLVSRLRAACHDDDVGQELRATLRPEGDTLREADVDVVDAHG
jgi:hypothetical protein